MPVWLPLLRLEHSKHIFFSFHLDHVALEKKQSFFFSKILYLISCKSDTTAIEKSIASASESFPSALIASQSALAVWLSFRAACLNASAAWQ